MSGTALNDDDVDKLGEAALLKVDCAADEKVLDDIVREYLGRKGLVKLQMKRIGSLPADQRAAFGSRVNEVAARVQAAVDARRQRLSDRRLDDSVRDVQFDPTLPGRAVEMGTVHPLTLTDWRLEQIFQSMGFYVLDYPQAESEFYNFEALNIPADHPAREMQDTFWLEDGNLLRTHTSAGQVRAMQTFAPPFRAIFPGRVFRYEATDASHEHTFHQVEGLYVDRKATVAHLIAAMKTLLSEVFARDVVVRLRPGYFPFVEPGFELDIGCLVCGQAGCSVCKMSGWVELLPCGLVHPNVLRAGGLDPGEWQGWAFGLGLSRLVMMKYKIGDVRLLLDSDIRFLKQFGGTGLE